MQVGIDSFAAAYDETSLAVNPAERLGDLVEQIVDARDADSREHAANLFVGVRREGHGWRSQLSSVRW